MDPRTRHIFAGALAVLVLAALGAAYFLGSSRPTDSSTAPSVVGVVVGIDSQGLDDVRGFDLRTADGTIVSFFIGDLENGAEFPPGHLGEHQATAEPIRVFYRDEGTSRVAIRIDDA